jgi:hypothetical protein
MIFCRDLEFPRILLLVCCGTVSARLLPKSCVLIGGSVSKLYNLCTWHFSADIRICRRPGGGGWCARNMAAAGGGGGTAAWSAAVVAPAIAGGLTGGATAPGNSNLAVALEAPSGGACSTGTPPSAGGEPT